MELNDSKYTVDEIETKLMSVLYANIDTRFSQFSLFNKLIKDKFTELENTIIHPTIKSRFLLILRNLPSRFEDIIVDKIDNVFYVVCLSSKENTNKVMDYAPVIEKTKPNTNLNNSNNLTDKENILDYSLFLDYIIDNNISELINFVDPIDSNTISHDLVTTSNTKKIIQFIDQNKFNFFEPNRHGKAPFQLAKTKEVSDIILTGLANKFQTETLALNQTIQMNNDTIKELRNQVILYESYNFKRDIIINTGLIEIFAIKINNFFFNIKPQYFIGIIIGMLGFILIKK